MRRILFRLAAATAAVLATLAMTEGPAQADAPRTDTGYQISMATSALCWQIIDGNPGNGVHIRLTNGACHSVGWDNQWTLQAAGTRPEVVPNVPVYRIHNRMTNKCLDVRDGSGADRATMQVWDCNPGWQQLFRIVQDQSPGNTSFYKIEPGYETTMCVTPNADNGVPENTELVQRPCSAGDSPISGWAGINEFHFQPAVG